MAIGAVELRLADLELSLTRISSELAALERLVRELCEERDGDRWRRDELREAIGAGLFWGAALVLVFLALWRGGP